MADIALNIANKVCVLGVTGSIGASTLAVMAANNFVLHSASAYSNVEQMLTICGIFKPKIVVMVDGNAAKQLRRQLSNKEINVLSGAENLVSLVQDEQVDIVMSAIVGAAGLAATLATIRTNKKILLANKESLVMAGELFMQELSNSTAELLPVDSEHNAILQCLPVNFEFGQPIANLKRIILTGSGGPFLTTPLDELSVKTPAQAVKHPNWQMGAKISVDSATMMNKGLEWIEAKFMFGIADEKLEIVLHPESIIHSMVEYDDGSVLAQMGQPDMRIPIAYCLGFPQRIKSTAKSLDFTKLSLSFQTPDTIRFPALALTKFAWRQGGTALAILNASNEIAVAAFLVGLIKFTQIMQVVEQSLNHCVSMPAIDLPTVINADKLAREFATGYLKQL